MTLAAKRPSDTLVALWIVLIAHGLILTSPALAAGPWKGQVVDAESSQPLADVIVFAVWWKRLPALIHEGRSFYYAAEVAPSSSGQFTIPAVATFTIIPFTRIDGPTLTIFRPGYGAWRFRGQPPYPGVAMRELDAFQDRAWKQFQAQGVVLELPGLRSIDKQPQFNESCWLSDAIPASEGVRLRQAVESEWKELARLKSGGR